MRVLIVDGDAPTAQALEAMLRTADFNVYTTDLGEEAVELAKLYDYDVIVLDVTLPDMSGFDAIRKIRREVKTPIMVLSAMALVEDKVKAIGLGADDYMTKPFHRDELVVRLGALVRRSKGHALSIITTGNLAVNISAKTVLVDGLEVSFTGKEYQILELLALRKGMTLVKEQFLNHLYGGLDEPEPKIIDVFICKIRRKMMEATQGRESFIETVWGRGYVLRDPPKSVDMASEVASLSDDPPTGYVSRMTLGQFKETQRVEGRVKKPASVS